MASIGLPELIVIGMILVLVFGASRLPQLGEGLGRAVRGLKRSIQEDERIEVAPSAQPDEDEQPARADAAGAEAEPRPDKSREEPADAEILDETKRRG